MHDPAALGARALHMVLGTLTGMAKGGIRDWVGGGFARYSTDPDWLLPHFEKMMYDNAQLLALYSEAYKLTKDEAFAAVAHATARCVYGSHDCVVLTRRMVLLKGQTYQQISQNII